MEEGDIIYQRFKVLEILGGGQNGCTALCEVLNNGQKMVVKEAANLNDPEFPLQEIQNQISITPHPCVVHIFYSLPVGEHLYLVQPYIEGGISLEAYMRSAEPLSETSAESYAKSSGFSSYLLSSGPSHEETVRSDALPPLPEGGISKKFCLELALSVTEGLQHIFSCRNHTFLGRNRDLIHGDLHAGNILLLPLADDSFRFLLIDNGCVVSNARYYGSIPDGILPDIYALYRLLYDLAPDSLREDLRALADPDLWRRRREKDPERKGDLLFLRELLLKLAEQHHITLSPEKPERKVVLPPDMFSYDADLCDEEKYVIQQNFFRAIKLAKAVEFSRKDHGELKELSDISAWFLNNYPGCWAMGIYVLYLTLQSYNRDVSSSIEECLSVLEVYRKICGINSRVLPEFKAYYAAYLLNYSWDMDTDLAVMHMALCGFTPEEYLALKFDTILHVGEPVAKILDHILSGEESLLGSALINVEKMRESPDNAENQELQDFCLKYREALLLAMKELDFWEFTAGGHTMLWMRNAAGQQSEAELYREAERFKQYVRELQRNNMSILRRIIFRIQGRKRSRGGHRRGFLTQ